MSSTKISVTRLARNDRFHITFIWKNTHSRFVIHAMVRAIEKKCLLLFITTYSLCLSLFQQHRITRPTDHIRQIKKYCLYSFCPIYFIHTLQLLKTLLNFFFRNTNLSKIFRSTLSLIFSPHTHSTLHLFFFPLPITATQHMCSTRFLFVTSSF